MYKRQEQGFAGGARGDTEWSQWVHSEKEQLSQVMVRHDIQWEQLGTHDEHLSVVNFKKEQRTKEVKALEKSIAKIQNQQLEVQAVDKIEAKSVPLSSTVMPVSYTHLRRQTGFAGALGRGGQLRMRGAPA